MTARARGRRPGCVPGRLTAAAIAVLASTTPLAGQAVRGDVDLRFQSLEFERWTGGAETDLVAVRPVVATVDLTAWGFGVPNLSVHLRTSYAEDLADEDAWPATDPSVRLVEGYVEYALPALTARAGRTPLHTRLGYESFDGARVDVRPGNWPISVGAFGGWSLARGSTLPITSPGGNPLGEFRPAERGVVFGGLLDGAYGPFRGSAVYRREVDPEASKLASEFVGLSTSLGLGAGWSIAAGADYDIGVGTWGTADGRLGWSGTLAGRAVSAAATARRYRPRFPLWSVWEAFSPVAHSTFGGNASIAPFAGLRLRGSAEWFTFEDTGVNSPLVSFEDDGWRWTAGAGWTGLVDWAFDVAFGAEFGPGASSTHAKVAAAWTPLPTLTTGAWASRGTRPLEYRIDDAIVRAVGLDVDVALGRGLSFDGGVAYYDEEREGGVARSFDHWRLRAGLRYGFGAGADRPDLHPAILRIPERPGS